MRIFIAAAAKSGSTAVYNSVVGALSKHSTCYSIFEPQRVYPILRLKNYDFSENFVIKVMVSRMISERSNFHFGWFDKRVILVRDVKDLLVSELLFRPMISPNEVDPSALQEFVALIREKEESPQQHSVLDLHKRADDLGISRINWGIFRKNLNKLLELQEEFDCSTIHFEDYARGDYSGLRQVLGVPVDPVDLEGSWVSHIQRKGKSGDWLTWFTPEDVEFVNDFFANYCKKYNYSVPQGFEVNTASLSPQYGSEYIEKKYRARVLQMKELNEGGSDVSEIDWGVLVSRARDGGVHQIDRLVELKKNNQIPDGLISLDELDRLKFFRGIIG